MGFRDFEGLLVGLGHICCVRSMLLDTVTWLFYRGLLDPTVKRAWLPPAPQQEGPWHVRCVVRLWSRLSRTENLEFPPEFLGDPWMENKAMAVGQADSFPGKPLASLTWWPHP